VLEEDDAAQIVAEPRHDAGQEQRIGRSAP
jgi:hypothetical protein